MLLEKLECLLVVTAMATLCAATQGKSSLPTVPQGSATQPQSIPSADGHHFHVLLLDGKNGKPVTGVWVLLKAGVESDKINWPQNVQSNSHGIAEFSLADPMPEKVGVSFGINEFWSCSNAEFVTDKILKSGVTANNTCAVAKVYSSHPPLVGQLVVFGRRITVWERIRQEIPFLDLFGPPLVVPN